MIQRNQIQQIGSGDAQSDALAQALMQLNQPQQQQRAQEMPDINPSAIQKMMGGGGGDAYGFGGSDPFSTASYAGGEGAVAGGAGESAAAGGGSSWGSMASSAGPWAALAAVIIGNEHEARNGGFRSEDDGDYAQDVLGGKVLEQDLNQRWLPKAFGENMEHDVTGLGGELKAAGELGSLDFGNALKSLKGGTLGKLWERIT